MPHTQKSPEPLLRAGLIPTGNNRPTRMLELRQKTRIGILVDPKCTRSKLQNDPCLLRRLQEVQAVLQPPEAALLILQLEMIGIGGNGRTSGAVVKVASGRPANSGPTDQSGKAGPNSSFRPAYRRHRAHTEVRRLNLAEAAI